MQRGDLNLNLLRFRLRRGNGGVGFDCLNLGEVKRAGLTHLPQTQLTPR